MAELRDMKGHTEQAMAVFQGRLNTNFGYEMLNCLRFLDPSVDQKAAFEQNAREEMVKKILKYAVAMFKRRHEEIPELALMKEIGDFISRAGKLHLHLHFPSPLPGFTQKPTKVVHTLF